jgi:dihydropteroate synthase
VGTSRKSFLAKVLAPHEAEPGRETDQRLWGTAATVAWAVEHGARVVRVHDVAAMANVVRMVEAVKQAK